MLLLASDNLILFRLLLLTDIFHLLHADGLLLPRCGIVGQRRKRSFPPRGRFHIGHADGTGATTAPETTNGTHVTIDDVPPIDATATATVGM